MNWEDIDSVIEENLRRLEEINTPYDPYVGTPYCDDIPRVRLDIPDAPFPHMWIPKDMEHESIVKVLRKAGTLAEAGRGINGGAAKENKSIEIWIQFCKTRCKYDFEFWAATEIIIEHKITLMDVPFVINRAQRYYLSKLEHLRRAGKPIFIILLKARQWGGSTLTQFYMVWIQMMWKKNWNSVICADVDDQALNVLGMFKKAIENYDTMITGGKPIKFVPYMGMDSTRVIADRGCRISVGSVQHPDKIRSHNITMAHLTEVGLWSNTLHHSPNKLMASIAGSIMPKPYRLKVVESTARSVGDPFHKLWQNSVAGKNEYWPVFVAWFLIDFYTKKIKDNDYKTFIQSMTAYEKFLFGLGATLEAINYYRDLPAQFIENPSALFNEFPSTPDEAFQSTGNNFYPYEYVEELRKGVSDPIMVGEMYGNARDGKEALQNVHFVEETNGRLKIWLDRDDKPPMMHRYLVIVDIGGKGKKSDNSVICVMDRYWMHEPGGLPEVAAEWCGHIDHDLLAWKAAQIATYYDNALLVVESNTLEMEGTEGNHLATLLSEIADVYDNMYCRNKKEQLVKGGIMRYGFHTNVSTKPLVCDFELKVLRDGLYIEHCAEAVDEHRTFETKENGELGAVEGCHDDRHITRAIGNYFCYHENYMPRVMFIEPEKPEQKERQYIQDGVVNEYNF